eukprot:RCo035648
MAHVVPVKIDSSDPTREAKVGDSVVMRYRCTLEDGTLFDSAPVPSGYVVGSGALISGFDEAVLGLRPGQSRTVRLNGEQRFGKRREDLVFKMPRHNAPEGLAVGTAMKLRSGTVVVVKEITDDSVFVDANHPLAEKNLD